ncbi:hypothetical protein CK210_14980 [Vibrio anguillarum]|nr:hypothetical protein CKY00_14975 [Vibrio anguillarum]AUB92019.1 hypothetical protein CKX99_14990 [Vibrio anguillarum]AUB95456.1 hypothetical protein CK210_14980 [Vibrio anguillarum]AUB98875.1 hypothetical protein CK209_14910 [Vibrio anguillarum]
MGAILLLKLLKNRNVLKNNKEMKNSKKPQHFCGGLIDGRGGEIRTPNTRIWNQVGPQRYGRQANFLIRKAVSFSFTHSMFFN